MTSLQSKTPPTNAFRFEAPLEFAKQSKDAPASDTKSRAITMLARTNKVIEHWYWGRCVHDFSGMVHADRIILDYCHGDDIIGYADQFIVDERGLTLNGRVESVQPDDEAELLLKRMDRGIPYQSSIYFDEVVLDWVPEGFFGRSQRTDHSRSADHIQKVVTPCKLRMSARLRFRFQYEQH